MQNDRPSELDRREEDLWRLAFPVRWCIRKTGIQHDEVHSEDLLDGERAVQYEQTLVK